MDPLVTIMRQAKVVGWPDDPGKSPRREDSAYVVPLSQALQRAYRSDAHFTQYATPIGRRLRTTALDRDVTVQLPVLVLDFDCAETHATSKPATDAWRTDNRTKMLALRSAHPGMFFYETRGGSRVVYRQPVPSVVSTAQDALEWRRDYAITIAYLARVFDLHADPACADWTRLFRLPHATRGNAKQPEDWPTAGDPANIAALWFEPTEEDRAAAVKLLPKAFEELKVVRSFEPCTADGYGLLYHALRGRGDLIRPFKRNGFFIRCPNEQQHTSGKTGDTSTVLFLPPAGEVIGAVWCLHAHCQALQLRDWLRCFAQHELDAAREAAGIARKAG
jgi:hypothetical protein